MPVGIIFKCKCMAAEATVQVRNRNEHEDVADWMELVQSTISNAHRKTSPLCMSATMEYAKIPMPENAPFIGGKPQLQS